MSVQALAGALFLLVLACALHFSSLQSMWHTWGNSKTYTHGYLVFPMVAYLIWTRWNSFLSAEHKPLLVGAVPIIGCGIMWVVAELLSVDVIAELMFVSMLVFLCASYFGLKKMLVLIFPLAYMFFAVPMGEGLVPKLMTFTADFTIGALRISGIPVFRDGMFFSIPAGDFEVAKACSGIRYLMASFALGTLYAYLSFRSFRKQFIFSVMSLLVPIIANGIRAYGIVIIAHFSGMKYATGFDHLIYGWVFFGFVMFLLFTVGGRFRSDEDLEPVVEHVDPDAQPIEPLRVYMAVAVLAIALVIPHVIGSYARQNNSAEGLVAQLPMATSGWQGPGAKSTRFEPDFSDAVAVARGHYTKGGNEVFVWVYRYPAFNSKHEMITGTNNLVDIDDWSLYRQVPRTVDIDGGLSVIESGIGSRPDVYTIWHWYQLNDATANGRIKAKLVEATSLLSGTLNVDEALVVVATPQRDEDSVDILNDFVTSNGKALRACAFGADRSCLETSR